MTDKPRKIVICHPDNVRQIQSGLVEKGITDVLVKADPHGVIGMEESFVMDPPPDVLPFTADDIYNDSWRDA